MSDLRLAATCALCLAVGGGRLRAGGGGFLLLFGFGIRALTCWWAGLAGIHVRVEVGQHTQTQQNIFMYVKFNIYKIIKTTLSSIYSNYCGCSAFDRYYIHYVCYKMLAIDI